MRWKRKASRFWNKPVAGSLLFIEDNEDILLNLFAWFEAGGYECDCARNGPAGLELAKSGKFSCIILDIMLPGMDGIELCRRLRGGGSDVPVIMLTARDETADKIAGLEAGADDYLVKPFSLKELEARIKAVLRRGRSSGKKPAFGGIELDPERHRALRDGMELRLSPTGFRILEALVAAAPGLVRREELEGMLWGDNPPEGSALRNHIHELRKVLDKPFARAMLRTVPHVGWRLDSPHD